MAMLAEHKSAEKEARKNGKTKPDYIYIED